MRLIISYTEEKVALSSDRQVTNYLNNTNHIQGNKTLNTYTVTLLERYIRIGGIIWFNDMLLDTQLHIDWDRRWQQFVIRTCSGKFSYSYAQAFSLTDGRDFRTRFSDCYIFSKPYLSFTVSKHVYYVLYVLQLYKNSCCFRFKWLMSVNLRMLLITKKNEQLLHKYMNEFTIKHFQ